MLEATLHRLERRPGVHRFLVTAISQPDIHLFHFRVCHYANAIEQRGMTVLYTVFDDQAEEFVEAAQVSFVSVQQRVNEVPFWKVIVLGPAQPWKP